MSCYAYREDPRRFVEIFNRTVEPVVGKCRLSTHLCFGNYKARAVGSTPLRADVSGVSRPGRRRDPPRDGEPRILPRSRSSARLPGTSDVAVGIIDVKSYYIETPADVAERVRRCLAAARPRSGSHSRPTAASARRRGGPPGRSCATWWRAWRSCAKELGSRIHDRPGAAGRRISRRCPTQRRRSRASASGGSGRAASWSSGAERHLLLDPYLSDSLTKQVRRPPTSRTCA